MKMAVDRGGCFSDLIDKVAHKLRRLWETACVSQCFALVVITTSQVLLELEATAL